jgi:RNA polymerase sigma factor (TIGR02999 family)
MSDVTQILSRIESGDRQGSADLLPMAYAELRQLAAVRLNNEKPGQTLQATALVYEAYLRLLGDQPEQPWNSRGHFFAAAAEAMRRILVEKARKKRRVRHGGEFQRVDLDDGAVIVKSPDEHFLAIDEALERLERISAPRAKIVKLRYFAGLTVPQAANAMGVSITSAERYWRFAKAWLLAEVSEDAPPEREF